MNADPDFKSKMDAVRASDSFKSALAASMRANHRNPYFAARQAAAARKTIAEFNSRPEVKLQRSISCRTLHLHNRGRQISIRCEIGPQALIPLHAHLQPGEDSNSDD